MVSIKKLEKMLRPLWIGGGASSEFTDYNEYRAGEVKVRIDGYYDIPYKTQLENAARQLGLIK